MNRKLLVGPAVIGLAIPLLAGCGTGGGGDGKALVVGTTDSFRLSKENPAPLDPATSYDIGGWNILGNTYQTLLRLPRSGTEPVPEAAEECHFTDKLGEQYRCTLRDGLTFSNGHRITSRDVKFSIDRQLAINDPNGPASLLANVTVETPDPATVVFHLADPDATFPFKLATPRRPSWTARSTPRGRSTPATASSARARTSSPPSRRDRARPSRRTPGTRARSRFTTAGSR